MTSKPPSSRSPLPSRNPSSPDLYSAPPPPEPRSPLSSRTPLPRIPSSPDLRISSPPDSRNPPPPDSAASPRGGPQSERLCRAYYLPPGQVFASREPTEVTTIVGSCVAVCLWDSNLDIGGMNHYLLPRYSRGVQPSGRFGDIAFKLLLDALLGIGCKVESLRATLVGGACMIQAFRVREDYLGEQNVKSGLRLLQDARIPVVEQATGGDRGRKIIYRTDRGSALIHTL